MKHAPFQLAHHKRIMIPLKRTLSLLLILSMVMLNVPVLSFSDEVTVDMTSLFPTEALRSLVYVQMGMSEDSTVLETDLQRVTYLPMYNMTPTAGDFVGIGHLTGLDEFILQGSTCTELPVTLFQNMHDLVVINISENSELETLPENIFKGLSHLESIILSANQLSYLPEDLFSGVPLSCDIDIRDNAIDLKTAAFNFSETYGGWFQYNPQFVYTFEGIPASLPLIVDRTFEFNLNAWNMQEGNFDYESSVFTSIYAIIGSEVTAALTCSSDSDDLEVSWAPNDLSLKALSVGTYKVSFSHGGKVLKTMTVTATEPVVGAIDFPDSQLKAALILNGIDTNLDNELTEAEMAAVTGSVYLSGAGIKNLSGIEHAVHVKTLDLGHNQVQDLTPLSALTELTSLTLVRNKIQTIAPLLTLQNLKFLDIGDNPIADFTKISGLTALETLYFRHQEKLTLDNIDTLNLMVNLKELWITGTTLKDISPIATLTNLNSVDLQGNDISDIEALRNLKKISMLSLDNNPIANIDPLEDLPELKTLWLRYNKSISDISALGALPNLYEVFLDDNLIEDISPLGASKTLLYLSFKHNAVTSLSGLENCTALKRLDIMGNPVESFEEIPEMLKLEVFRAEDTKVVDFTPLSGATALVELSLSNNHLLDISFLSGLTQLKDLGLGYNEIQDISPINSLINLETVFLNDNLIQSIPEDLFLSMSKLRSLHLTNNALDLSTQRLHLPESIPTYGIYYNNQFRLTFAEPGDPIVVEVAEHKTQSVEVTAEKITALSFDQVLGEFTGVQKTNLNSIADHCAVELLWGEENATVEKTGASVEVTGLKVGEAQFALVWTDADIGVWSPKVIRSQNIQVDEQVIVLPKLSFSVASASVDEGQPYTLYIQRNIPLGSTTCLIEITGGTAKANDYTLSQALPLTVTFANGETRKALVITPALDGKTEGQETLKLGITKAGYEALDPVPTAVLTIEDSSIGDSVEVVSVDYPKTMIAHEENSVTVQLRNTGNTTWAYSPSAQNGLPHYDLIVGVEGTSPGDGPDDLEPVFSLMKTHSDNGVEPGEIGTYTLKLTPHSIGAYGIKLQMLGIQTPDDQGPVQTYFGEIIDLSFTVREPVMAAEIINFNMPSSMLVDQPYTATIEVKNTGETTWVKRSVENGSPWDWEGNLAVWYLNDNASEPNKPAVLNDSQFAWSLLTSDPSVAPGETVTYTYSFTPKRSAVGQQKLSFRMLGLSATDQYAYFGETKTQTVTIDYPQNDAKILSVNYPDTMIAGQSSLVTVKLLNSGTKAWIAEPAGPLSNDQMPGAVYELKIGVDGTSAGDGPDDLGSGLSFVRTSDRSIVQPGETVTYTFEMTAAAKGSKTLKLAMLGKNTYSDGTTYLEYFGERATIHLNVREPIAAAQILSIDQPTEAITGQTYTVKATVKNMGETTWALESIETGSPWDWPGNTLVWYMDNQDWAPNMPSEYPGSLMDWHVTASDTAVQPGETVTYTYVFTPRYGAVGAHTLTYRMLGLSQSGVYGYFGDPRTFDVTFKTPWNNGSVVSVDYPKTMITGIASPVQITIENTGSIPWDQGTPTYGLNTPDMPGLLYELKVGTDNSHFGNGVDNLAPHFSYVRTSTKSIVLPGETVTYTLMLSPKTVGNYHLNLEMLGLNFNVDHSPYLEYFGDQVALDFSVRAPIESSEILNIVSPSTMVSDQGYPVTVTVKNTGETTWTPDSLDNGSPWDWPGNVLVWYLDGQLWQPSQPGMTPGALFDWTVSATDDQVAPGETVTYTFVFTPRKEAVGNHLFTYQVLGLNETSGYHYFGQVVNKPVTIKQGNTVGIPNVFAIAGNDFTVANDQIQGPDGVNLMDTLTDGKLEVPLWAPDDTTVIGKMVLTIEPLTEQSGRIVKAVLQLDFIRQWEGRPIPLQLEVELKTIPTGGSLEIVLNGLDSVDPSLINGLLNTEGKTMVGAPLIVVDIIKHQVPQESIGPSQLTIHLSGLTDPLENKTYTMLKKDDQTLIALNTAVEISGQTLTVIGMSPGGFSQFIVVETGPKVLKENAEIKGSNIPETMKVGQTGVYWLDVKNTGTVPWKAQKGFAFVGLTQPTNMGQILVPLLPYYEVKPGQTYRFFVLLKAPKTPQVTQISYEMTYKGMGFGQKLVRSIVVEKSIFSGDLVSIKGVNKLIQGQKMTLEVVFKNTGNSDWSRENGNVVLKGLGDARLLGFDQISLPWYAKVRPGEQYAFRIPIRGPQKQGNYQMNFQLFLGSKTISSSYPYQITVTHK